jgi:MtrB/PioB family decaheme-associated outer membrane protein
MMPSTRSRFPVPALLLVGFAGVLIGPLHAAEPDKSDWECRFCEFPSGTEVDVDGGVIWVSDDAAKFGDFTGLDEEGAYLDAHLALQHWGENGDRWQVLGRNLGLDSRELSVTGGRQGLYELNAYYSQIPRSLFDTTQTPFLGAGSELLSLPDNWVNAGSTQGMSELDASLQPLNIGYDREIFGVGAKYLPWQELELTVEYRHDEKDGIRIDSGNMLTVVAQFVEPLDQATDTIELAAGYSADAWNLQLGYYGSFFTNRVNRLRWETPFNPTPGAEVGQLDVSPDNDFHQFFFSGGYRLPLRTNLTGRLAIGKGQQKDNFLPYTVNPLLAGGTLPRGRMDGNVDTTNINLRLRSNPVRNIGLTAEYRKSERDNETSQHLYEYVITDSIPGATVGNQPYSFDRDSYRLSADYRLMRRTRLAVGWNRDDVDRDFQEREKTETDKLWARATIGFTAIISGWVEVSSEERDGSEYTPLTPSNSVQNPLMRKYHLADRDRDAVEGQITVQPIDAWDFSLSAAVAEDDYDNTLIGLTESEYMSATLDTSVRVGPVTMYAAYTREEMESKQNGSQTFSDPDWSSDTKDEFDTLVFGFKWPEIFSRVDLNLDYTYAKSSGDIDINVLGARSAFPQLDTELDSLRLYLDYQVRDNLKVRAGYWYEHYSSSDWALDNVFPATVPQLLSLGANAYNYNVNTVLLSVNYSWE